VIVFFVATAIFKQVNKVEYEGLTFTKEKVGNIPVYHYFYYFTSQGELIKYNLFLRNDPRENNVPVEGSEIIYEGGKFVYLTLNTTGIDKCEQSVIAVADLSKFITHNQFTVKSGTLIPEEASEDQDYITCENRPDRPVISIIEGEETKITIEDYCYTISVANCDIMKATEKFKLQSVLDAKKRV
jgi:hypothetical protein